MNISHKKIIPLSIGVVFTVIIMILAMKVVPMIAAQYDTYIAIPSHLSSQDRAQLINRWREILNEPNKGKNNAGLYNNIGILRGSVKEYDMAVRAFKIAIARDPTDPRYYRNLAITYTYMGDYGSAEVAFRKVFSLDPKHSEYWLELGELYSYYVKDFAKAKAFYLEALSSNPNDISTLRAYANFLENIDMDYIEAMKYWSILTSKDSTNQAIYSERIKETQKKIK